MGHLLTGLGCLGVTEPELPVRVAWRCQPNPVHLLYQSAGPVLLTTSPPRTLQARQLLNFVLCHPFEKLAQFFFIGLEVSLAPVLGDCSCFFLCVLNIGALRDEIWSLGLEYRNSFHIRLLQYPARISVLRVRGGDVNGSVVGNRDTLSR